MSSIARAEFAKAQKEEATAARKRAVTTATSIYGNKKSAERQVDLIIKALRANNRKD